MIVFYLKYATFFLHLKPPHLINPKEFLDRPTATRAGKGKSKDDPKLLSSTGAWPCKVGVHRVVWNNGNGLASSSLLAASTASGLCRVDVLWGRWFKDKPPYGGAEGYEWKMRMLWMLNLREIRSRIRFYSYKKNNMKYQALFFNDNLSHQCINDGPKMGSDRRVRL